MKKNEAIFWRNLLRSDEPLTRAQRDELAMFFNDQFVAHHTAGRPYKTALERTNYRFTTGLMNELLQQEMAQGKSRIHAAEAIVRMLNWKTAGLKPPKAKSILRRIERWQFHERRKLQRQ
jgi:hypothetical protein